MTHLEIRNLLSPVSYANCSELPLGHWRQLEEGDYVIVQRDGEPLLAGEVDIRPHCASVFWVWLDGGRGRIAVYADEGTSVWVPNSYQLGTEEELAEVSPQPEVLELPQA